MKKTKGQILYEYQNPSHILVVAYGKHKFARECDAFLVPNPAEPTPWKYLTAKCHASYEERAKYHHHTIQIEPSEAA